MASSMAMFWYRLVKAGTKTIDQVPAKYREEVEYLLAQDE